MLFMNLRFLYYHLPRVFATGSISQIPTFPFARLIVNGYVSGVRALIAVEDMKNLSTLAKSIAQRLSVSWRYRAGQDDSEVSDPEDCILPLTSNFTSGFDSPIPTFHPEVIVTWFVLLVLILSPTASVVPIKLVPAVVPVFPESHHPDDHPVDPTSPKIGSQLVGSKPTTIFQVGIV